MAKGYVKIEGLDDIKSVLNTVAPNQARNLMRATVHGLASSIAKDARAIAPVGPTGQLKKAIKSRRRRSPPDAPVSEVYVQSGSGKKPDAWYWRFVEYGTRLRGEKPFIRPVVDAHRATLNERIMAMFGKKLEAALKRAAKKRNTQ